MKTLNELKEIRDLTKVKIKGKKGSFRICVGMGTCGIAAGAKPIMDTFISEINQNNLTNVFVTQVGCKGQCVIEPMADIIDSEGTTITYSKLTANKVSEIVRKHIIGGKIVNKYTYSNSK